MVKTNPTGPLLLLVVLAFPPAVASADGATGDKPWPRGRVFTPKEEFSRVEGDEIDPVVLNANPRLFLFKDFDPSAKDKIMVIGLPGWGGRSENFIRTLVSGLARKGLTRRLVLAAIQDLENGGPRYQGQGDKEHANRWSLRGDTIKAMRRFIARVANRLGPLQVYFFGYSTGSVAGPILASSVARWRSRGKYRVRGAISVGTGSPIAAGRLLDKKQRVLFIVVPEHRGEEVDGKPMRSDQGNRRRALQHFKRLSDGKAEVYLRQIESARKHLDWHWGLLSQCRYFPSYKKPDPGRGYYPHYWRANPETYAYVVPFLRGQAPPDRAANTPQSCPTKGK